jgi:hypothetical protein
VDQADRANNLAATVAERRYLSRSRLPRIAELQRHPRRLLTRSRRRRREAVPAAMAVIRRCGEERDAKLEAELWLTIHELIIRPLQDSRAKHCPIGDPSLQFQEDLIATLDLARPAANVCFRERAWMSRTTEIGAKRPSVCETSNLLRVNLHRKPREADNWPGARAGIRTQAPCRIQMGNENLSAACRHGAARVRPFGPAFGALAPPRVTRRPGMVFGKN